VRLLGIGFGVPCAKEADTFIADHVRMLREGEVKLDRALSVCQYPSLLAHAAAPLSANVGLPRGDERTLEEHLASAASVWVELRGLVAVLSVLVVPATFLVARRFVSRGWALFAACLVSFSLLHVLLSQEARAHGAVVGFSTLAMASALWMRRAGSWASYLATAVLAALAVGTLHNGLAVLAPVAVAQLLRPGKSKLDPRILIVGAAAAAAFRVFYWYYFDEDAKARMAGEDASQSVVRDLPFDGSGFARLGRTIWYYEPVLLALIVLAGVVWLARRGRKGEAAGERGDLLVVLSYVAPYLLLAGLFNQTYERFLLPLLPYLAVFAAWGLAELQGRWRRAVPIAAALVLAVPAFASTKLSWMRSRPTTIDDAAQWVREHLTEPASQPMYALPPLDLPLFRTLESLRPLVPFTPWAKYQNRLEGERPAPEYRLYWMQGKPEHQQLDTDERVDAYVRSFGAGLFLTARLDERQSPERRRVIASMERLGSRVARFSPDGDPNLTDHQLWDQDVEAPGWPHVTWRVLRARAVGPVIEIYRIE
jgi:hypothetical protein